MTSDIAADYFEPPAPPPDAIACPPVAPTVPKRILDYVKVKDFECDEPATARKMAALFSIVQQHGSHKMKSGSAATKNAWVDVFNEAYNNSGESNRTFWCALNCNCCSSSSGVMS